MMSVLLQSHSVVLCQIPVHWSLAERVVTVSVIRTVILIQTKFHCMNLMVSLFSYCNNFYFNTL